MASRLSEDSVRAVYDAGHQALLVQNDRALQLLTDLDVDLNALLDAENPEAAVQAVPALALYQALKRAGVEDNLDILPLMSSEQVQRTFDYEAWEEDRLDAIKTVRWLQMFNEVSDEELANRFKGLEEELQLAFLSPFLEIVDEDAFEKLGDAAQDEMRKLPCNTLYYRVKSQDQRIETMLDALIEAMLKVDLQYAYSLMAHATYVPPTEQEDMAAQFRRARIEEDGFVSYEESLDAFLPVDLRELEAKTARGKAPVPRRDGLVPQPDGDSPYLVRAMQRGAATWTTEEYATVVGGYAFLGNTLAAAAQIETDDLLAMRRVLQQAQALAGLGLEHLSRGDVGVAAGLLKSEHPKTLFRAGLTLVGELQDATLGQLEAAGLGFSGSLRKLWILRRAGVLLAKLDTDMLPILGLRRTETLKGLFNRMPVRPEAMAPAGEGGRERMIFSPIASLAALADFSAQLAGFGGVLHVATLAGPAGGPLTDLDRRLATAMARTLLGETFIYKPLKPAELSRIVALPSEAAQAYTNDLFAGIEGTLKMSLATAGRPVDAVQAAMGDLTDLAMRMHLAREHDRRAGDTGQPAALSALVDTEVL